MTALRMSAYTIRNTYNIDDVENTVHVIFAREGAVSMLRYATDRIQDILARCLCLDALATHDAMKGLYTRSAPFLVAFDLATDLDIDGVLHGRICLQKLAAQHTPAP